MRRLDHIGRDRQVILEEFGAQLLVGDDASDFAAAGHGPVALGFEIAEIKGVFEAGLHAGDVARDLAADKRLAADRAFMVEQDAVLTNMPYASR
jgi:hypothetical protein